MKLDSDKGEPMTDLDWLAEKALGALRAQSKTEQSWINDKQRFLTGKDRLAVLRWIVTELDGSNKKIVASALEISSADLAAVERVLRKI